MSAAPPIWDAAVLCGGASRRMGADKALLEIDGVPLARRVASALRDAGAGRVIAVGGELEALARLGLEPVADGWPGAGPLGGVVTALGALDAETALVASCDLVRPSADAMRAVVDALAAEPAADAAIPWVGGRPQWVHAAWRPSALAVLRDAWDGGERAIHRAAAALAITQVGGLPAGALADADTPEAFASATTTGSSVAGMEVPEIDVDELARRREQGAVVIDVREDHEYARARVPGVVHIPLGDVVERSDEVPRDVTVYVICGSGPRSAKAAEHYRSLGIDAVNVAGGTRGWIEAGHPTASGPDA